MRGAYFYLYLDISVLVRLKEGLNTVKGRRTLPIFDPYLPVLISYLNHTTDRFLCALTKIKLHVIASLVLYSFPVALF